MSRHLWQAVKNNKKEKMDIFTHQAQQCSKSSNVMVSSEHMSISFDEITFFKNISYVKAVFWFADSVQQHYHYR